MANGWRLAGELCQFANLLRRGGMSLNISVVGEIGKRSVLHRQRLRLLDVRFVGVGVLRAAGRRLTR